MGAVTFKVKDAEGNVGTIVLPYTVTASTVPKVGTTPGPVGIAAAVAALPGCQVVHSYQNGAPTKVAADSELAYCAAHGLEVWYSFGSMPTQAAFQACVADWMKAGNTFYWMYINEVDGKIPPAQFVAQYDQLQLWAEAVPGYAASKVRDQTSFKSYMLTKKNGVYVEGDPNLYVPTRPTRLGWDIYVLAQIPLVLAFNKAHGLNWALLEHGCGGAGGEVPLGWTQAEYDADRDGGAVAWCKQAEASWQSQPPQGRAWYANTAGGNARSDTLVALPKTAAHLSSLIVT